MKDFITFAIEHKFFIITALVINVFIAYRITGKLNLYFYRHIKEAMGGRCNDRSLYIRCRKAAIGYIDRYVKEERKTGILKNAKSKMKKAGYTNEYSAVLYLLLKYAVSAFMFTAAFVFNYPDAAGALILAICNIFIVEAVVKSRIKDLNMRFRKHVYKIYKYLHNQISSGVKVTDAVKGVYEVIEDRYIRDIMIRFAASYELTLDIEKALDEFTSSFDGDEAETLCIAIRQGIMTGDNRELLSRQEDVMFKKYFNYIQAETDSCRNKSLLAAALFTVIIVIMIAVPLLNDMTEAVGRIFLN